MPTSTDRIQKQTLLNAPLERVWRAIGDAREFGSWFGMRFDGPFVAGEHVTGRIVPTTVDPEMAEGQKPYEGTPMEIIVDRIEPMRLFSFRWHPYAVDPGSCTAPGRSRYTSPGAGAVYSVPVRSWTSPPSVSWNLAAVSRASSWLSRCAARRGRWPGPWRIDTEPARAAGGLDRILTGRPRMSGSGSRHRVGASRLAESTAIEGIRMSGTGRSKQRHSTRRRREMRPRRPSRPPGRFRPVWLPSSGADVCSA